MQHIDNLIEGYKEIDPAISKMDEIEMYRHILDLTVKEASKFYNDTVQLNALKEEQKILQEELGLKDRQIFLKDCALALNELTDGLTDTQIEKLQDGLGKLNINDLDHYISEARKIKTIYFPDNRLSGVSAFAEVLEENTENHKPTLEQSANEVLRSHFR